MATKKESNTFYATGRRKTSAARVFLRSGTGKITINKKERDEYLQTPRAQQMMDAPMKLVNLNTSEYDLYITVKGGGPMSQAGAIRHGLSRVLLLVNGESRGDLKKAGFLTRDSRMVERKKYGRHKARKSTQFSKR